MIARPFVNAIYGAGAEGVQVYVDKLAGELADTMSMCGAHSLAEITRKHGESVDFLRGFVFLSLKRRNRRDF
mgnify:CR=1 FL=1